MLLLCMFFLIYYLFHYYSLYQCEMEEKLLIEQLQQYKTTQEEKNNIIGQYSEPEPDVHEEMPIVVSHSYNLSNSENNTDKSYITYDSEAYSSVPSEKDKITSEKQWIGDCIIYIPSIDLKKIVYTGNQREEHLENYELVTANGDMKYEYGGNYIICGHASRLYGHSLNRLKELKTGAAIQIITPDYTDEYTVSTIKFENMYQTDNYCNQSRKNMLTILSCAKYVSNETYIVIQAIKKEK